MGCYECLYTVSFSMVRYSFTLNPIVRRVSPMYTVPHAEHIILYTTFLFRHRFDLDDIMHVSHPSGRFCFTLGGAKTFDKRWLFIKCTFLRSICVIDLRPPKPSIWFLRWWMVISNRRIVVGNRSDVYCYEECFSSQI
jgi:hypothetical protein